MTARESRQSSFGGCSFVKTSPAHDRLAASTQVVNLVVPFEDALKLNVAIDEAVRRLNSARQRVRGGKRAALNLTIHFHTERITVSETRAER